MALNQKETVEYKIGSHLALVCTAESGPVVHFQWLFNNAEQNVTGSSFITQLDSWKDQGNYTCQATNPFTRRSASASVCVTLAKGEFSRQHPCLGCPSAHDKSFCRAGDESLEHLNPGRGYAPLHCAFNCSSACRNVAGKATSELYQVRTLLHPGPNCDQNGSCPPELSVWVLPRPTWQCQGLTLEPSVCQASNTSLTSSVHFLIRKSFTC